MKLKMRYRIATIFALMVMILFSNMTAYAGTVYLSDEVEHEEGYIIIGESHIVVASDAYARLGVDASGAVVGVKDVNYSETIDSSEFLTEDGTPNTFIMKGNLFFVFEGNAQADADKQLSKDYVFSDGNGGKGIAVQKIHKIMLRNLNVKHWNIICYSGAWAALNPEVNGPHYVESYKNWIGYEFPEADIYFVSHSTMTPFYKQNRYAFKFDDMIKEAFPDQYLDYTDFYKAKLQTSMMDSIHWTHETYIELFNDVINKIASDEYPKVKSGMIYKKEIETTVNCMPETKRPVELNYFNYIV